MLWSAERGGGETEEGDNCRSDSGQNARRTMLVAVSLTGTVATADDDRW